MTGMFDKLPGRSFPLRMELVALDTGKTVWEHLLVAKGDPLKPGPAEDHGPVLARVTYADGLVTETYPNEHGKPAWTTLTLPEPSRPEHVRS